MGKQCCWPTRRRSCGRRGKGASRPSCSRSTFAGRAGPGRRPRWLCRIRALLQANGSYKRVKFNLEMKAIIKQSACTSWWTNLFLWNMPLQLLTGIPRKLLRLVSIEQKIRHHKGSTSHVNYLLNSTDFVSSHPNPVLLECIGVDLSWNRVDLLSWVENLSFYHPSHQQQLNMFLFCIVYTRMGLNLLKHS